MMRLVKAVNKAQHCTILECEHILSGLHVSKEVWCSICAQNDYLNRNMTNMNAQEYVDPLWTDKSTPTLDSFQKLLHDVQKIHDKKKHDYSQPGDRWSNFTESGIIGSMFKNPTDNAFAVLIGVKLSRLSNLLGNKLVPNNESIDDTFLDLTTYCALWATYHKDNK